MAAAVAAQKTMGVPIKLLHEAENHTVTVEMKNGEVYRGLLVEAEDTMNSFLTGVTMTARNGRVSKLEQVYLRGSHVKYMILPEILRNAPIFKGVTKMAVKEQAAAKARGTGRGRGGGRGKKAAKAKVP